MVGGFDDVVDGKKLGGVAWRDRRWREGDERTKWRERERERCVADGERDVM